MCVAVQCTPPVGLALHAFGRLIIRIIVADTYYDAFVADYQVRYPHSAHLPYVEQHRHLMGIRFGSGDAYASGFRELGHDAHTIVLNAENLQRRWAREEAGFICAGERESLLDIFEAQLRHYQPDVLFVQELSFATDELLARVKPNVGLIVGQVACSLPRSRTFANHDIIVSSWPPIVEYFRSRNVPAEFVPLGFDKSVLDVLEDGECSCDVTFVGGMSRVHRERQELIEYLGDKTNISVFGYGKECLSRDAQRYHGGAVWGTGMYRILSQSRVTVNIHGQIDVGESSRTDLANNMRLFEATGCGTLLLSEMKSNLDRYFDVGTEMIAFGSKEDCLNKLLNILDDEDDRRRIAAAGQRRTLSEHTIDHCCRKIMKIIENRNHAGGRGSLISCSYAMDRQES